MSAIDLARVAPGYDEPVHAAQRTFRAALEALARPGRVQKVAEPPALPGRLAPAAAALALTLLDGDTAVWLSPSLAEPAVSEFLRFHTGAAIVGAPGDCTFAFVANLGELPEFDELPLGSDESPERSATVVLQIARFVEPGGWLLRGPGIRDEVRLGVDFGVGVSVAEFAARWRANRAAWPRGVDMFFVAGTTLAGLPRTTRLEV